MLKKRRVLLLAKLTSSTPARRSLSKGQTDLRVARLLLMWEPRLSPVQIVGVQLHSSPVGNYLRNEKYSPRWKRDESRASRTFDRVRVSLRYYSVSLPSRDDSPAEPSNDHNQSWEDRLKERDSCLLVLVTRHFAVVTVAPILADDEEKDSAQLSLRLVAFETFQIVVAVGSLSESSTVQYVAVGN